MPYGPLVGESEPQPEPPAEEAARRQFCEDLALMKRQTWLDINEIIPQDDPETLAVRQRVRDALAAYPHFRQLVKL